MAAANEARQRQQRARARVGVQRRDARDAAGDGRFAGAQRHAPDLEGLGRRGVRGRGATGIAHGDALHGKPVAAGWRALIELPGLGPLAVRALRRVGGGILGRDGAPRPAVLALQRDERPASGRVDLLVAALPLEDGTAVAVDAVGGLGRDRPGVGRRPHRRGLRRGDAERDGLGVAAVWLAVEQRRLEAAAERHPRVALLAAEEREARLVVARVVFLGRRRVGDVAVGQAGDREAIQAPACPREEVVADALAHLLGDLGGEGGDAQAAHPPHRDRERVGRRSRPAVQRCLRALPRAGGVLDRRALVLVDDAEAEDRKRPDRFLHPAVGTVGAAVELDQRALRRDGQLGRHVVARRSPRREDAGGVALAGEVGLGRVGVDPLDCSAVDPALVAVGRDVALGAVGPYVDGLHGVLCAAVAPRAGHALLGQPRGHAGAVAGEQVVVVAERGGVYGEVRPRADRMPVLAVDAQDRERRIGRGKALLRGVLGDVLVEQEGVEGAVARGAAVLDRPDPDPRGLQPRHGVVDRVGDTGGSELEDARVERVAAHERVAVVVGRPDRARRGVRVRGRQEEVVGRDPGVGDPLLDLLGQRVGQPAEVGLDHGVALAVALEDQRARQYASVDPVAGPEGLGVVAGVGVEDDLVAAPGDEVGIGAEDERARRVGEHRRGDRRRDVGGRRAGEQRLRPRVGDAGEGRQRESERHGQRGAQGAGGHAHPNARPRPNLCLAAR